MTLGRLDVNDYELMAKETQQQIFIQQKDKIQTIIDKKVDGMNSMNFWPIKKQMFPKSIN